MDDTLPPDSRWRSLMRRLTAHALVWFRAEGCPDEEAILLNTGTSAVDLAFNSLTKFCEDAASGKLKSALVEPDGRTFLYIKKMMRRDFLDLVRADRAYKRTESLDAAEEGGTKWEEAHSSPAGFLAAVEDRALVRRLHLILGDDEKLKEYVTVWLLHGAGRREDIADALGVSVREVKNRRERLLDRLKPYRRAFLGARAGGKANGHG